VAPTPRQRCTSAIQCELSAAERLQVFFKMDKTGAGEQVLLEDLPHTRGVSLAGFTGDMFMQVRGQAAAGSCGVRWVLPLRAGSC
jgi:hypothetical protein